MDEVAEDEGEGATRSQLRGLIEKQGYCCALTGIPLEPNDAELDHVVPVSGGGTHAISNLQVLHKAVNRMKGAMSNDEFVRWCRLVAKAADTPAGELGSPRSV